MPLCVKGVVGLSRAKPQGKAVGVLSSGRARQHSMKKAVAFGTTAALIIAFAIGLLAYTLLSGLGSYP